MIDHHLLHRSAIPNIHGQNEETIDLSVEVSIIAECHWFIGSYFGFRQKTANLYIKFAKIDFVMPCDKWNPLPWWIWLERLYCVAHIEYITLWWCLQYIHGVFVFLASEEYCRLFVLRAHTGYVEGASNTVCRRSQSWGNTRLRRGYIF